MLDPAAQLKIVDFTGRAGAEKLANAAGSGQVDAKQGKGGKPKKEIGESGSVPKQVRFLCFQVRKDCPAQPGDPRDSTV